MYAARDDLDVWRATEILQMADVLDAMQNEFLEMRSVFHVFLCDSIVEKQNENEVVRG